MEPCDMVRQVNLLSLRTWGTSVCAVKTEDEAISRLKLRSESRTLCYLCDTHIQGTSQCSDGAVYR